MGNLVTRLVSEPDHRFPREPFPGLPGSPTEISSAIKSTVQRVFAGRINEVHSLHHWYRYWLPIQRCQISFYIEKLESCKEEFVSFSITANSFCTEVIRNSRSSFDYYKYAIVKDYRTSRDFEKHKNPPNLNWVGDQLVLQVAEVYQLFGNTKDWNSPEPDFSSRFYFDKKKFQEKLDQEVFVGLEVETSNLLKKLVRITKKQLEVISIVGMAGLGKTTLARRLYNNPYIVSYFYIRAWVTCSQAYKKRDVLLGILRSVVENADEVCSLNDNMLAHELYRALMGRRYLIVIDDIWSSKAWDELERCFPNDNNGSKVMLTTRLNDVALHAQSDRNPLCLRFLTEEESIDLLKRKAFIDDYRYNYELTVIGKVITKKCQGLPLAIVVIAGLLQNNLKIDWWKKVAKSVSSYIVTDENQYMNTLALSYHHLPTHLRPCFLYFGAFPEDHDIPVSKLISLWIAEGYICVNGTEKTLENVAKDYLMDLMSRSMVVGKKGSSGAIKTCHIHDLLRDLCLKKTMEENFSPQAFYNKHSFICPHSLTNPSQKSQLMLNKNAHTVPSNCSCYSDEVSHSFFKDVSILWNSSELIRALDMSSIEFFVFPVELLQLVHLRYLELRFRSGNPPDSISHLTELQTLIMSSRVNMVVPDNMWKMINLKNLCIKSGENHVNISDVEQPSILENLRTMSLVSPSRQCEHILARAPNLLKLGFCGLLTTKTGDLNFPDLSLLVHLETLKLLNTGPSFKAGGLSESILFPNSLKSLSISNTYLDWKEAWVFEMIPNLEVLKLKLHAFVGEDWDTSPGAFPRLKFLKLDKLDIVNWTTSCNHFPVLQHLQVYRCPNLMEIPGDFGNICTLEWIKLSGCSNAATNSARDIQKEQESNGNDWPKVLLKRAGQVTS